MKAYKQKNIKDLIYLKYHSIISGEKSSGHYQIQWAIILWFPIDAIFDGNKIMHNSKNEYYHGKYIVTKDNLPELISK